MLSHLYLMINKEYLAIPEKFEKLIISLRTAHAKEYSLDKEQTSYDDLLYALRLSLKAYTITWILLSLNYFIICWPLHDNATKGLNTYGTGGLLFDSCSQYSSTPPTSSYWVLRMFQEVIILNKKSS